MHRLVLLAMGSGVLSLPPAASATQPGGRADLRAVAPPRATGDGASEAVQARRERFVAAVRSGTLDRFDEVRQEVMFKRGGAPPAIREPGPLEDEAVASAARSAIAATYSRLKLRPRLTCTAGRVTLGNLANDPVLAGSIIDTLLALDGVQNVTATLPACLRLSP